MNKNIKSTILVTGSEGNIGTYVIKSLHKFYPEAHLIRIFYTGDKRDFSEEGSENEKIYKGDLRNPLFVKKVFQENSIDYVVHMAARLYGVAGFNKDVYGLFSNDIECLLNVLDNSMGIKKIIYFSSSMIYESSEEVPFTEELTETILPPRSSYGLTKFFGEKAVKYFSQQFGIDYTIWRPFNVVSPLEDHNRESGHVLIVEKVSEIEIYGSGKQVRCFTWVEDVVDGVAKFLTDKRTSKEIFNIGSSEPKNILELKDALIEIGKKNNLLTKEYNPKTITNKTFFEVDVQLRIPDVSKIKRRLGWECNTDFKTCFEKFIDYKQHHAY